MNATNPYAPPRGAVHDVADPYAQAELAEPVVRLVAAILDVLIFAAMCYLPFAVVVIATGTLADVASREEINWPVLGLGVVLSLVGLVAWVWLTTSNAVANGQTIAKKMLDIKVVRSDGSPASLSRIFWLRNFVNGLLGVIPLYVLIDVLLIFGAERQCIHDKIADTIVVKA